VLRCGDRVPGDEVRRQLVDNGCDHHIQVRDLVMQFEVAASEGFEADTIGGLQVPIRGQVRAPRRKGSGQTAPGALRRQPTSRPIGVRVRPPGNWRLSSDYPSGGHSRKQVRGSRSRR
jgi:hypothetical protein